MHFLRGVFGTGFFPSLVKLDSLSMLTLSFIYPGLESIQSLMIYHDQLPVLRVKLEITRPGQTCWRNVEKDFLVVK